jgi:three-Cys-motif partner protein
MMEIYMEKPRSQQFGGLWTADKLDRVSRYLQAYTTALKKQPFHLQYIDAFAGTGYCGKCKPTDTDCIFLPELAETETQEFLKGSARIALENYPPFQSFVFIDNDPDNCTELNKLGDEFPTKRDKITIVNGDANKCLLQLLRNSWRDRRAVLFLDPFGMQVRWETVQAIARTQAIDMWYLFPLAGVNRLLRKDAELSEAWRERLNLVFGTNDWEQEFYRSNTELTLFGPTEVKEKIATFDGIKEYLLRRLKAEFAGVAKNPLVLVSDNNSPLYLLCFAAANKRGASLAIRIAEYILGK